VYVHPRKYAEIEGAYIIDGSTQKKGCDGRVNSQKGVLRRVALSVSDLRSLWRGSISTVYVRVEQIENLKMRRTKLKMHNNRIISAIYKNRFQIENYTT
jgi:hypothetical protein